MTLRKKLIMALFCASMSHPFCIAMDGPGSEEHYGFASPHLKVAGDRLNASEWILRRQVDQAKSIREKIAEKSEGEAEYIGKLREELNKDQQLIPFLTGQELRVIQTLQMSRFTDLIYLSPMENELRSAIDCFYYLKNQAYIGQPEGYQGMVAYLNEHAYYASHMLLMLLKDSATVGDISLHWLCCNEVRRHNEAYDSVILMLNKYNVLLESFQDWQVGLLVNTFSHCTIVDPQKRVALEHFLMKQGTPASYTHLLDLYVNRGMHEEIVALCHSKSKDLLTITDGHFHDYLKDIVLSCLIAKDFDLSERFLQLISEPFEAFALKALTCVAKGEVEEAQSLLQSIKSTVEQNYGTDIEVMSIYNFVLNLVSQNVSKAIKSLEYNIGTNVMQSANLIYLKKKLSASSEEIRELERQHWKNFGSFYYPSDFRFSNAIIDLIVDAPHKRALSITMTGNRVPDLNQSTSLGSSANVIKVLSVEEAKKVAVEAEKLWSQNTKDSNTEAVKLFQDLYSQGRETGPAAYRLGVAYYFGRGVEKNLQTAFDYLSLGKDRSSLYWRGLIYADKIFPGYDLALALKDLEASLALGMPNVQPQIDKIKGLLGII